MFPWWGIVPMFYPMLPNDCDLPPTIYSLLDAIVNYNSEEETPIKNLAKSGRSEIFDFDYPLSSNISKEDFEVMILNNYMMRRIGYETLTWNLFTAGENITRTVTRGETSTDSTTSTLNNTGRSDSRFSDTPQGRLTDIESGTYMTDYTLEQNSATSTGSSSNNINKSGNESETINRTPENKIEIYKEFQNEIRSIYELIFNDLDDLFYSLT